MDDAECNEALRTAAESGDLQGVRELIRLGAGVNTEGLLDWTPLFFAAIRGHAEVVRHLVASCGVDVDAVDMHGGTALMRSVEGAATASVGCLLDLGADVDSADFNGFTPLMRAVEAGSTDIAQLLINRGADIDRRSDWGSTALSLATERGDPEMQALLVPRLPFDGGRTGGLKAAAATSAFRGEKWQIPPFEVELLKAIDVGGSGGEYRGKWLDADVMVKLFIPDASDSAFSDQVRLWKQLRHPNILHLYGACDAGLQFFVCELASHGSVTDFLRACDPSKRTPWGFLHQAALGLAFLHERGKVHGSLRCSNILVGSDGLAKLANFGLSRVVGGRGSIKDFRGATRWKAPEWFPGKEPTIASDEYAFGLCILEAVTGNMPWSQWEEQDVNAVKDMWQPESSDLQVHTPGVIRGPVEHFTSRLCCLDPNRRVSIESVICDLEKMAKRESREESADSSIPLQSDVDELGPVYKQLDQGVQPTEARSDYHYILGDVCGALDNLAVSDSDDQHDGSPERGDDWVDKVQSRTPELQKLLGDGKGQAEHRVVQLNGQWMMLVQHEELSLQLDQLLDKSSTSKLTASEFDELRLLRKSVAPPSSDVIALPLPVWFLPKAELQVDILITTGSYGRVSHAKWLDSTVVAKEVIVAAKNDGPAEMLSRFKQEADIWFGLNHPHVVQLHGASHLGTPFFVCEYAANGIIVKYVHDNPSQLWIKLHEAALGLQYLHERGIVHGDLKGNNIMIGSDDKAKVADFGLSWAVDQAGERQVHKTGAFHWVAPECHDGVDSPPTFESDVYAFGMCVVEAMRHAEAAQQRDNDVAHQGLNPWGELGNKAARYHARRGELPPKPERCTREQWSLVESMCRLQPRNRIKISTVVDKLADLAGVSRPVEGGQSGQLAVLELSVPEIAIQMLALLARPDEDDDCSDLHILCQVFELLWRRLQRVWAAVDADGALDSQFKLRQLVERVREDTEMLQSYRSLLVQSTEAALRAFAAHRRLDKFLAAHFLTGKDGEGGRACDWKAKCYALLGIEVDEG